MATNKERLDALSAKLKETQETLNNKILALDGGGEIEVELPEEFGNPSLIYHFQVNKNTILFSCSTSNIGVWIYHIREKSWKQGHSNSYYWRYYQQVGDNCLIGNASYGKAGDGLLLYDAELDSIVKIWEQGYHWNYFTVVSDGALISQTTTGMLEYNLLYYSTATKTLTPLECDARGLKGKLTTKSKVFLSALGGSSHKGLYKWDEENHTISKVYDDGVEWNVNYNIKDRWFISGGGAVLLYDEILDTLDVIMNNSFSIGSFVSFDDNDLFITSYSSNANNAGLYYYRYDNNSFKQLCDFGYYWTRISKFKDFYFISSNTSAVSGLYKCKPLEELFELITDTYKGYDFIDLGDECLFYSGSPSGLHLYNSNDNTVTQINSEARTVYIIKNNTIFFCSSSSLKGILEYDIATKTVSLNFTTLSNWLTPIEFDNKILFRASSGSSAVEYNVETEVYTQLKFGNTNGPDYCKNALKYQNLCFMSDTRTDQSFGLYKYDSNTGKINSISTFSGFNTIQEFDNYCILTGSKAGLKYDILNNKATLVAYKLKRA